MANVSITNLPPVLTINGTEIIPAVQLQGSNPASYVTVGLTTEQIVSLATGGGGISTLAVAAGGTGNSTLTLNGLLLGNGTSPITEIAPVATGSVLISNGTGYAPSYSSSPTLSGTITAAAHIATESISGSMNQGAFSYGTLPYSDVDIFASFQSTANSYAQIVLSNSSNLGAASTDFVVGNDKTTATTYYGDFGMNSSGWTGTLGTNSLNAPSVVYLSSTSSDLVIGTTTSNYVRFVTSGGADALTISPSGVVTIPNADIIQTSLTTPIVYGGSTSSSSLTLESTSATSGTFSDSILFKVGNAGSPTTAMSIASGGLVTIPTISVTPTASAPSAATGTVWYDSTKDSLSYYNATGYEINIGQQVDQICYNNTGSNIPAGTAVYLSGGSNGNAPYISPAIATSVGNANMVGITGQTIANGSTGIVVILGEVFNYNTTGWTAGQTLYLSSSTAGALTTTQPSSPFYAVRAGFVVVGGSSTNGIIFASVRNVYTLGSNIISPVTFTAFSTSSVPLVVNGLSGQFTDLIQVNTYSGGTKAFSVGNTGTVSAPVLSYTTATGATSETVPLVIGGTAASSTLTLQSTSGTGTSDSIIFQTGSQATRMTISTAGLVTANNFASSSAAITGGSVNGTPVGASTASTGAFTTLSASSTVSGTGFSTYLSSPPAIGNTAANTGAFTTLSASSTVTLNPASANVLLQPTGTGVVTIAPATLGTINNMSIGATTASTGSFTFVGAGTAATTTAYETVAAGTTSVAPIKMTSGTNLTTASAGAVEYDGTNFYTTPLSTQRGVQLSEQYINLSSSYTLTSQTAAQKLFNSTTNGAVTLAAGTYEFECFFTLSSMSSSSGTFGFALGGTATFTQGWSSQANQYATLATANSGLFAGYYTSAGTALAGASASTPNGMAIISGIIRVTSAGTVIPQVSLTVASAAVVGANSYFRIRSIGSSTATNVGNWS